MGLHGFTFGSMLSKLQKTLKLNIGNPTQPIQVQH